MLTDVEIAQSAKMKPIVEVAQKVGLDEDDLELYGKYKAKISLNIMKDLRNKEDGKLVLITAINPTFLRSPNSFLYFVVVVSKFSPRSGCPACPR